MEDRRLTPHTVCVDLGARIYACSVIEQNPARLEKSILSGDMKQRPATNLHQPTARRTASESKNAKGFRVLLHPSAQSEWDERLGEWEYPQLPADEQSKDSVRELNFLRVGDGGNHWDHCRGAVDEMRKWFSNERAECHYDGTVRTLDRFERERRTRFAEADAEGPIYILRHKLGDVKET